MHESASGTGLLLERKFSRPRSISIDSKWTIWGLVLESWGPLICSWFDVQCKVGDETARRRARELSISALVP